MPMNGSTRFSTPLLSLYAGQVRPMPDDGRPTAIFKQPVQGRMRLGLEGLEADAQADRRVHGGPEKALHHFPLENHRRLAASFPEQAGHFVAGGIGENLSTEGCDEDTVCIGDVYALGTARVQLNQPRSPCWKIDAKFGREGITRHIAEQGLAGWYYRVLAPGEVQQGDAFTLLERNAEALSLRALHRLVHQHRPELDALRRAAATPGLNESWRKKLLGRADWLEQNRPQ